MPRTGVSGKRRRDSSSSYPSPPQDVGADFSTPSPSEVPYLLVPPADPNDGIELEPEQEAEPFPSASPHTSTPPVPPFSSSSTMGVQDAQIYIQPYSVT